MEFVESEIIEGLGINTIRTNLSVGSLTIMPSDNLNIEVESRINIEDEESQKVLEKFGLLIDTSENVLDIYIEESKDKSNKIIDLADKFRSKLDLEIVLKVPKHINNYIITLNAGDVKISDLKGMFDITTSVGKITLDGVVLSEYTKIKSNVGDITLNVDEVRTIKSIDAFTNVGDIRLSINDEKLSDLYKIDLSVNVGNVRFYTRATSGYVVNIKESLRTKVVEKGDDFQTEINLKSNVGSALYKNI